MFIDLLLTALAPEQQQNILESSLHLRRCLSRIPELFGRLVSKAPMNLDGRPNGDLRNVHTEILQHLHTKQRKVSDVPPAKLSNVSRGPSSGSASTCQQRDPYHFSRSTAAIVKPTWAPNRTTRSDVRLTTKMRRAHTGNLINCIPEKRTLIFVVSGLFSRWFGEL